MPQFLHASDIHLDSPMEGFRQRLDGVDDELVARARTATRTAFAALVDTALELEVSALILAGDLYDGDWRDFSTGLWFSRQMDRLHQATIPVYLLRGNHDALNKITRALRPPPNVHEFAVDGPQSFISPDESLVLHGQGFASREVKTNLASRYPVADRDRLNIGVLHTSLTGREHHAPYAPCEVIDLLAREYQYWALGHVHKREVVVDAPSWIIYPGNLQGRNTRETGPKGATLVSYEGTAITDVEALALHDVRWERVTIPMSEVDSREGIIDAIELALEQLGERLEATGDESPVVVRLVLTGATSWHGRLQEPGVRDALGAEGQGVAERAVGRPVLIEKLQVATQRQQRGDASPDESIWLALATMLQDPGHQTVHEHFATEELRELDRRFKLGLTGDDEFAPGFLLEEAQALLESRLSDDGQRGVAA